MIAGTGLVGILPSPPLSSIVAAPTPSPDPDDRDADAGTGDDVAPPPARAAMDVVEELTRMAGKGEQRLSSS